MPKEERSRIGKRAAPKQPSTTTTTTTTFRSRTSCVCRFRIMVVASMLLLFGLSSSSLSSWSLGAMSRRSIIHAVAMIKIRTVALWPHCCLARSGLFAMSTRRPQLRFVLDCGMKTSSTAASPSFIRQITTATRGGDDHHIKDDDEEARSCLQSTIHASRVDSGRDNDPAMSKSLPFQVWLAVGSNLGDRFKNIYMALQMLCSNDTVRLLRTSFVYETAPMYVTTQPAFLNGVVWVETTLDPDTLLQQLKQIETALGRDLHHGIRNGPRIVDLDILLYYERRTTRDESKTIFAIDDNNNNDCPLQWASNLKPILLDTPTLQIPHPRMMERDFVLVPLHDVAPAQLYHPVHNMTVLEMLENWVTTQQEQQHQQSNQFSSIMDGWPVRVLPLPRSRCLPWYRNQTLIMGILNVTPDSFSDGGQWNSSIDAAVQYALDMQQQGAAMIDIGGESTRPGADDVTMHEELRRVIPVIHGIRQVSDIPLSIDTRRSAVAKAAIEAGADVVNDVSGGTYDPDMLSTVAALACPYIIMHMRGTPQTMQDMTEYDNQEGGVVVCVVRELAKRCYEAEQAGIHRWLQLVDPGIGFAKDLQGNLSILKNLSTIRSSLHHLPILVGTSRKGFLGTLVGESVATKRDVASVASVVAALCLERHPTSSPAWPYHPPAPCSMVRVHNVADTKQALLIMDAIHNAS